MIRAVIFDLDGTLADTLTSIADFGNRALLSCGLEPIEKDTYRYLVGNGRDVLIRRMVERSHGSFDPDLYEKAGAFYDAAYAEDPLHLVAPFPHIPELLQRLQAEGILCVVLSNKPHDMTQAVVQGLFPEGTFRLVYGQQKGVPVKPDPTAARRILQELELTPEECLYVGDTGTDMKTGKNAGFFTVGVLWGFRMRDELEEQGADGIIADPLELLPFTRR